MAQFNLSTVCLLLVLAVSLFTLQAESACCTKYSRAELPKNLIKGFSVQNIGGKCNINAVVFHTLGGRKVCADPAKPWVMDMIQELRTAKMAQFNLSTVCLLLVLTVSLFTLQAESACCTKYSRAELSKNLIKGFSIQTIGGRCNINAVVFHTLGGRKVCADPAKSWVMDMIQELRSTVQKMSSPNSQTQSSSSQAVVLLCLPTPPLTNPLKWGLALGGPP
ncbi:uncharacterized protein LOC118796060 [Megalops cyprinoides]|uniref:uncharacterized protein LOC118796060 n=1 Tax=Megalops cyprinoides TaxID=118141 RepID=UPI00186425C5|nr:uncharacterized protein LOC118796060 [Megalops cyprinoides]